MVQTAPGWLLAAVAALATTGLLVRALRRSGAVRLGPANRVTLLRGLLVCVVAGLVADSFSRSAAVPTLVAITSVALVLDAVDGRVARRTGSVSVVGARFDMEVDAFLILALSVYVARSAGLWVLAIGLARYGFVAARWVVPWLRGTVPPRRWCKVVAAIQGMVLTVVAADVLAGSVEYAALAASLALLAESFGREVWWLRSQRSLLPGAHRNELTAAGVRGG